VSLADEDKQWTTQTLDKERGFLLAKIEKVETCLLTEFHKWASPTSARMNAHSAAIRALDAQQEYLEDRITKLEGGRPPQQ
jgi:hypothetical protein